MGCTLRLGFTPIFKLLLIQSWFELGAFGKKVHMFDVCNLCLHVVYNFGSLNAEQYPARFQLDPNHET